MMAEMRWQVEREGPAGSIAEPPVDGVRSARGHHLVEAAPSDEAIADILNWLKAPPTQPEQELPAEPLAGLPQAPLWGSAAALPTAAVLSVQATAPGLFRSLRSFLELRTAAEFGTVDETALTLEATVFEDLEPVDLVLRVQPCRGCGLLAEANAVFSHPSSADVVAFRALIRRAEASLQAWAPPPTGALELCPFEDDLEDDPDGETINDDSWAASLVDGLSSKRVWERQQAACLVARAASGSLCGSMALAKVLAKRPGALGQLLAAQATRYPVFVTLACIGACNHLETSIAKALLAQLAGLRLASASAEVSRELVRAQQGLGHHAEYQRGSP